MSALSNLGYVVFEVSDLDAWADYATNIVGLQIGDRDEAGLSLRMDELQRRVALEKGSADDLAVAGWQLDTEDDLETYVRERRDAGLKIREGGRELAARRGVEKLYQCEDPIGFRHEFFFGPAVAHLSDPFRSSVLQGSGFVTGKLGMGHILPVAKEYGPQVSFYKEMLGLRISDYIREEIQPGMIVDATFFHAATGRHHSIATAVMPHPKRLHHVMVQVQDMNDVGLAYDRAVSAGIPIHASLGHHPNDRMFSFYMQTPSGFGLEYGWGGIIVDDDTWEVTSYSQLSDWGHKPGTPA